MWELVATAVAGLNAGAGLQAAIAGAPSAALEGAAFSRFAGRSRMLGLLLSTVATSACVTAYYGESRGALWLAAAAGVGIGIPFNLLLMNPPSATTTLEPALSPRVRFAQDAMAAGAEVANDAGAPVAAPAAAGEGGTSAFEGAPAAGTPQLDRSSVLSSATVAPEPARRRRLLYSKSGVLVSAADLESSWAKRYWFSAALSLTAFACMMAMIGTGRDAATYGYAPY